MNAGEKTLLWLVLGAILGLSVNILVRIAA